MHLPAYVDKVWREVLLSTAFNAHLHVVRSLGRLATACGLASWLKFNEY
jgi:hypothetical protein